MPNINTITTKELKQLYDLDPQLCLIDVRELSEWSEQHIPRARHIPKNDLPTVCHQRLPVLDQPIYIHCRSGVRSLAAAECLTALGYTNVYSVEGGIVAWSQAGYPTQSTLD